jgi:hypothetical protein
MQKIILNVPQDLHEALRARKEETGTPTSVFIRRLIQQALLGEPRIEKRTQQPVLVSRPEVG